MANPVSGAERNLNSRPPGTGISKLDGRHYWRLRSQGTLKRYCELLALPYSLAQIGRS